MNRQFQGQPVRLTSSRRQRTTPYTERVESLGVSDYSIVNHMILPKGFGRTLEEDYWHLRKHVQIWDVSCQRQVELAGPDAQKLLQLMTPRDISRARRGKCLYAPLVDEKAGMINDPVILKLGQDHFWLSISDSDVLLWAKGLATGWGMDVSVEEPDVSPLAVQGPLAEDTVARVFGDDIRRLQFFEFDEFDFQGRPLVVARSGYSRQGGFEIYLDDATLGAGLWDAVWEAGRENNIAPGAPNLIERVEGGLLSYGNEMTRENNPLECGMERFCTLDGSVDFIGRDALFEIARTGPDRCIRGIVFNGEPVLNCRIPLSMHSQDTWVGQVTTAAWSPRLEANISLGMVERDYWDPGQRVTVCSEDGTSRSGSIVNLPIDRSNLE